MNPFEEQKRRQQGKEYSEELKQRVDRNIPFDVAELQHKNNQELLREQHNFARELLKEQHALNSTIIKKQTIITIIASLCGVIIGAFLTTYLPTLKKEEQKIIQIKPEQVIIQPKNEAPQMKKDILRQKEADVLLEQGVNTLKNASSSPPIKKK
ncbi:MAG TPA: hypothetical protein DD713_00320 [Nitrospiraceae bacterium]|nr:hypothetical protein [Nitrospiraceae bacterium]